MRISGTGKQPPKSSHRVRDSILMRCYRRHEHDHEQRVVPFTITFLLVPTSELLKSLHSRHYRGRHVTYDSSPVRWTRHHYSRLSSSITRSPAVHFCFEARFCISYLWNILCTFHTASPSLQTLVHSTLLYAEVWRVFGICVRDPAAL